MITYDIGAKICTQKMPRVFFSTPCEIFPAQVLEVLDVARGTLIVPSAAAAHALHALGADAISFTDARNMYDKVLWYGERACFHVGAAGGFVHGITPFAVYEHGLGFINSSKHLLATKPDTPLLIAEAVFLAEYTALTGGCCAPWPAEKRWTEARVQQVASWIDAHAVDQPAWRAAAADTDAGSEVALKNALWCLCVHRVATEPPAPIVANRLMVNVHTSIAHKVAELVRDMSRADRAKQVFCVFF